MLEHYEPDFDPERFIKVFMTQTGVTSEKTALMILRRKIPKESFFQDRVKKALKKSYPQAFIRKISQGVGSEGGTPDLMMILDGHYFGFEIKRPVVGELKGLQREVIRQIGAAKGTAAVVRWPEEAIAIVEGWRSHEASHA